MDAIHYIRIEQKAGRKRQTQTNDMPKSGSLIVSHYICSKLDDLKALIFWPISYLPHVIRG